jgi:hypothetical protein
MFSPQDLNDLIKHIFRNRPGRKLVERGDYDLTNENDGVVIESANWRSRVAAGSAVAMNVIIGLGNDSDDDDSRLCPSCGTMCEQAQLGDMVKW